MADRAAILGAALNVDGDPGAVKALAAHLHGKAHLVGVIRDELFTNARPATWKGAASDGFKSAVGELPTELGKLFDSYGMAGRVLTAYAEALGAREHRAQALADRIADATRMRDRAHDAKAKAHGVYTAAQLIHDTHGIDPGLKQQATRDMTDAATAEQDADKRIGHHQRVIDHAWTAAKHNHAAFTTNVETCCTGLATAGARGIRNKHYHGVDGFLHGLDSVVGVIWDGLGDILDELSDLLDIGSIFAGLLVVAAGIATIITDGAAAPLLLGSLDILEGVTTAKIATDIGAVATGKDPRVLIEDAISVIAGKFAGKVIDKAFPVTTYTEVQNALEAAARVPQGVDASAEQLYAQRLLRVLNTNEVLHASYDGMELGNDLRKKLEEIFARAGCSVHSASVPVHG